MDFQRLTTQVLGFTHKARLQHINMLALITFAWPLYAAIVGFKLCLLMPLLWRWNFPLAQIPGPSVAAWTRLWWIKALYSGRSAQILVDLNRLHGKHSPVVRIGPKTLVISDPSTIRRVLGVNSPYLRGPWFDSLRTNPHTTSVVSERESKKHQAKRQILAPGLSGKDVAGAESVVDMHIGDWMRTLFIKSDMKGEGNIEINLSKVAPFLSLDIITHLCLGQSFNNVKSDSDNYGLLEALSTGMIAQQYIASLLELKTALFWLGSLPYLRGRLFPTTKSPTGIGQVMRIIQEKVQQKLRNTATNDKRLPMADMLDSFLSRGLNPEEASSEILVVLFSAVGATSYTMQGIIHSVISNPNICHQLQHEIDIMVEEQGISTTECAVDAIIKTMPYLQACISEGLRMYPAITQLRERVVPPEGDNIHGHYVPGGTFIALNGLASHLDPIYGNKLDTFRPERWLDEDKVLLARMQRNLDLTFGYGSSKCLGENLARMELNKVIFELFRRYDVEVSNTERPWSYRGDFVLADFNVLLKGRMSMAHDPVNLAP
ncbi:hypothetical protein HBI56_108720 [Parastagonospora nodorum]|uniref:Cytochrome P450 n=2 Tax=Phaeosphaeria nodorum (strain SN15 / ATCC MYA-4574 / FGSC 10173) TaxID=321614 RepID=A0A7U2EUD7_PHANO|nr:hypothetical protein SNOG_07935 [Parastagonospora nodorum SN15]KAH3917505.1 hypothetical protein HBH56_041270 [Parastagonospora nodorum]EAT84211.1 hypothetical protein SNOG_07935 [Parastagonospora nodorum SN15]KAH3932908.1 hypothetical protein HBH54_069020 [Parastagonospora nodorum]KAH3961817.1 hypothetical protein HBH52_228370 [Parastagonospora nodorum]KAH3980756.1 hypothetical protein HBH51_047020 [Parastagonospora nodorum]